MIGRILSILNRVLERDFTVLRACVCVCLFLLQRNKFGKRRKKRFKWMKVWTIVITNFKSGLLNEGFHIAIFAWENSQIIINWITRKSVFSFFPISSLFLSLPSKKIVCFGSTDWPKLNDWLRLVQKGGKGGKGNANKGGGGGGGGAGNKSGGGGGGGGGGKKGMFFSMKIKTSTSILDNPNVSSWNLTFFFFLWSFAFFPHRWQEMSHDNFFNWP